MHINRILRFICLGITAISIVLLVIVYAVHTNSYGYDRFYSAQNGQKHFNWPALLSPAQVEYQEKIPRSTHFTYRVPYPVAPKFQMVVPKSDTGEEYVGQKIASVIRDSARKVYLDLTYDYDGTSAGVRAAHPHAELVPADYTVTITLRGTASPEAVKYGLRESLAPGHIEQENVDLAYARLRRTAMIIQDHLDDDSVRATITNLRAEELQLDSNQIDAVVKDPHLLDSMRYVEATVTITGERVRVVPVTAPVLLPLWLLALSFLFYPRRNYPGTDRYRNLWGEKEGPFWDFLDFLGIRRTMKYWYVGVDHLDKARQSGFVICSTDRRFPAYDAHIKLKQIMDIHHDHSSLHHEIHHHIRISKAQYIQLLCEEDREIQ